MVFCNDKLLIFGRADINLVANIMNKLKQTVKQLLRFLHLDVTRNMKYDRQTSLVVQKTLKKNSATIDVGCHKGEMLLEFLQHSPQGVHFAFEPIPAFYEQLKINFNQANCHIFPYALAEKSGTTEFNYVKNAPAYSGLKQRKYAVENPEIEKIQVEIKTLDELIPRDTKIDLLKIDVEGAELGVLKGGLNTIKEHKPVIIFECGLGASDFYGTKPEEVFDFITAETGLQLSTMQRWLKKQQPFTRQEFCDTFNKASDYYFMAYAKNN